MNSLITKLSKLNTLRFLHGEEGDEMTLSLATLVLSIMLVCYIICGPLLKKFNIKILRPSGVIMIFGIILTLLTKMINPNSSFFKGFQFNHSFFFTFILPIIIFSSAYNSKIESILKYFRYILLFSIPGTMISFIIISAFTYYFNNNQYFTTNVTSEDEKVIKIESINLSLSEILQFCTAISASDSVISLSFLMEDNEPKLNAISLGDSILNNAVVISLFNSVYDISQKEKSLTFSLSCYIFFKCIIIFIASLVIGIAVGIFHSIFLVYMKKFHMNRVQEISTILLFAFISYILCDWLELSAMTSLLACGLCMSHYMFYNLNYQTREESSLISLALNIIAEGLIYSSMGMTIVYYTIHLFSGRFIATEFILIVFCRIFTIFGQIYILELCGVSPQTFKLKTAHKSILTGLGSIRGVVSFGLSLLIHTTNEDNKTLLVGSTIYIVFLTNILCILISPLFKRREKELYDKEILQLDTSDDKVMKHDIFTFIHPNTEISDPKPKKMKNEEKLKREQNSLINRFIKYDNEVIRPKIIPKWPEVKEDNNNISRKIKKALGIWAEQKEKYHTYKENDTIQFYLPGFNIGGENNEKKMKNEEKKEILETENEKNNINSIRRNYQNEKGEKKKIELNEIISGQ
jgi:NhaP-type Na+/H+ or K+/H+ antiporter